MNYDYTHGHKKNIKYIYIYKERKGGGREPPL